ncbi:DUF1003 domain-containing protein [Patescibacteria group bacterium]|nr:DUF1003 domain-containing protein [Patescibacteria group bacterium]
MKNKKIDKHPINARRDNRTLGQRASDKLTEHMGSWHFIFIFLSTMLVWIIINVLGFVLRWDPYPFILLNLCLSCLAAIQAPIIMMSQNRQAERDRLSAKYDYAVNRKAEKEIQNMQKDLDEIKEMLRKKH